MTHATLIIFFSLPNGEIFPAEVIMLMLQVEDPGLVGKRVMFAYEQCLLCLGHHPDIWLEAALYLQDTAKILQVCCTLLTLEIYLNYD